MPHISRKLLLSYIYSLLSIACGILVGNLLGSVKRVSDADSTLVFVQIWCSLLRRKLLRLQPEFAQKLTPKHRRLRRYS
jgi:hypothetical protein